MEKTFFINGDRYTQWFIYGIEFLTPTHAYKCFGKLHFYNRFIKLVKEGKEPVSVIFQNTENWEEDTIIIYPKH